jgi:hypothetical protein
MIAFKICELDYGTKFGKNKVNPYDGRIILEIKGKTH